MNVDFATQPSYSVRVQINDGAATFEKTLSVTVQDATSPVADLVDVVPDPRMQHAGVVTVNFSESVSGVDIGDLQLTRDGGNISLAGLSIGGTGPSRTLDLSNVTNTDGDYVLTLRADGSGIQDGAGNLLTIDAEDRFIVDLTRPSVTANIVAASLNDGVNSSSVTFEFSEAVSGFDADDVSVTNGTLSNFVAVDGDSFTATFTANDGIAETGSVSVGTGYTDAAGNVGVAGSDSVTIDTLNPTVVVNIVAASLNDGANSSSVTFEFSEAVSGFDADDVSVTNGTLSDFAAVDGDSFTATFTANDVLDATGSVSVGTGYTDVAGNVGAGGSDSVAIDTLNPTLTVNIVAGSLSDGANSSSVTFEFSEAVTGFDAGDVSVSGGVLSGFEGSGASYSATFTADDDLEATGSVSVVAGSYSDAAGNSGGAGSDDVAIDTLNPTLTVNIVDALLSDGDSSSAVTFVFSEPVTGFVVGDVTVAGGTLSDFSGSGTSYLATITATDGFSGTGSVTVAAGSYTDAAGNPGSGGSDTVEIDTLEPILSIAAMGASKPEGNSGTTDFMFTVTRGGDTTGSTSVNYAVTGSGSSPANAADFGGTLPTGTVSFTAGQTSKTITVRVSGDVLVELDEVFTVTLSGATGGAVISTATATGAIQNDDADDSASVIDLSTLDGTTGFRLNGIDAGDQSGYSVSSAGDVNGDGFDDLIIGALFADPGGDSNAGESYVVFGKSGGFGSAVDLSTLDGTTGFRLDGIDASDLSGRSVSSAGDVNGDGFDDLIIGARNADPGGDSDAGESYVVFGGNFTGGAETQVGDATANTLTANQGPGAIDILIGGLNDDTLISDGGADVLRGGEGNDTLAIPDADFSSTRRIVGGNGTDTLRLDGSGITLDLTTVNDKRIVDVEVIDITGSGDNTLTLDVQEVLNISSHSNTLLVRRNAGDTVNIGTGWFPAANQTIDSVAYQVFTQGAATVLVESPVTAETSNVAPMLDDSGNLVIQDTFGRDDTIIVALDPSTDEIVVRVTSGSGPLNETRFARSQITGILLVDLGGGNDSLDLTNPGDAALESLPFGASIDAGPGDDTVTGSAFADRLLGNTGSDSINGGTGNDTPDGGDGNDTLTAGDGADVVFAGAGFDVVDGGAGNDRLFGDGDDDTISGGTGNDFIRGGTGSDRLFGDDGQDEIIGDQEADTLTGGDGNDTLTAGDGDDVVFAGAGFDLVNGGAGNDRLFGDGDDDTISGGTGNDFVRGGIGNDVLNGDGGFDTLYGDQGDDTISGGDGNDTVFAGTGRDSVSGGGGNDRLFGDNGYDTISGGSGNDFIRGGRGQDSLTGDAGDDELLGDEHEDTLIGGSGSDRADGGAGADTIDVQEAPQPDGIDSVVGGDMADTIFMDPDDLLI